MYNKDDVYRLPLNVVNTQASKSSYITAFNTHVDKLTFVERWFAFPGSWQHAVRLNICVGVFWSIERV